ncbi:serine protein kinase RIO [Jiangella gansuensis]|uniref:serine protein kinase RIO n=1 Tax=Jiangella gansuensis TaxID=281473 RepID=UPI0004B86FE5|nr:RIO1 family regulatory kinase/ATPase [Jiangella gansuensis]
MHDNDSFAPMRPRGRANTREERADIAERSLDDAFAEYAVRYGLTVAGDNDPTTDGPPAGDRWSTWDESAAGERGPQPYPDWVITELAAVDTELGVLKTGKEADVFLLERAVPDTDRATLLAAKRYRDLQHRMFHRDAGYLEGRRDKESRINRAMAKRTAFGRDAIAGQWAYAEFAALSALWSAGVAVPYPVQILGTELLMEFIGGDDGVAAPRLAQLRPDPDELDHLWEQLVHNLSLMALAGYAHGDLSAYNLLVEDGRLVIIDVPQIVDVIGNPHGRSFLDRDVRNVGAWFTARGLHPGRVDDLGELLAAEARLSG